MIEQALLNFISNIRNSNWDQCSLNDKFDLMTINWAKIRTKTSRQEYGTITENYHFEWNKLFANDHDGHVFAATSKEQMATILTQVLRKYKLSVFQ